MQNALLREALRFIEGPQNVGLANTSQGKVPKEPNANSPDSKQAR